MRAMETRDMNNREWAPIRVSTDHRKLTNEELHALLCIKIPQLGSVKVTDDIRETIIAMIEISD
jgi:hypothetical protein